MKTPEEAIKSLEDTAEIMDEQGFIFAGESVRKAVKILKPLAMQDRERSALAQHWES